MTALEALQDEKEHRRTRRAVEAFLNGEGPEWQEKLIRWAEGRDR